MNYIPGPAPLAAKLESYEFKEWLNSIQRFYYNEIGTLVIDEMITAGTFPAEPDYYPLKMSDSIIVMGDTLLSAGPVYRVIRPPYYNCLGKAYYIIPTGANLGLNYRYLAGDRDVGGAAYGSAGDAGVNTPNGAVMISTKGGWAFIGL